VGKLVDVTEIGEKVISKPGNIKGLGGGGVTTRAGDLNAMNRGISGRWVAENGNERLHVEEVSQRREGTSLNDRVSRLEGCATIAIYLDASGGVIKHAVNE
jgi:sugar lactone lactonase YvrE